MDFLRCVTTYYIVMHRVTQNEARIPTDVESRIRNESWSTPGQQPADSAPSPAELLGTRLLESIAWTEGDARLVFEVSLWLFWKHISANLLWNRTQITAPHERRNVPITHISSKWNTASAKSKQTHTAHMIQWPSCGFPSAIKNKIESFYCHCTTTDML